MLKHSAECLSPRTVFRVIEKVHRRRRTIASNKSKWIGKVLSKAGRVEGKMAFTLNTRSSPKASDRPLASAISLES